MLYALTSKGESSNTEYEDENTIYFVLTSRAIVGLSIFHPGIKYAKGGCGLKSNITLSKIVRIKPCVVLAVCCTIGTSLK